MVCSTWSALNAGAETDAEKPFLLVGRKAQCSCKPNPTAPANSPAWRISPNWARRRWASRAHLATSMGIFQAPGFQGRPWHPAEWRGRRNHPFKATERGQVGRRFRRTSGRAGRSRRRGMGLWLRPAPVRYRGTSPGRNCGCAGRAGSAGRISKLPPFQDKISLNASSPVMLVVAASIISPV